MDYLLRKKYQYLSADSYQITRDKLGQLLDGRQAGYSDIYGKIAEDGAFNFRRVFSFFSFAGNGQTIYLKGKISDSAKGTAIDITLSPNLSLIIAVYLILLVSLNVLFGDNSLLENGYTRLTNMGIIISFEMILFAIIQTSSSLLRRKFEKAINFTIHKKQ